MADLRHKNRNLILLLIAAMSVIVLIYCVVRLSIYSLSSYRTTLSTASLKNHIGDSSVVLTTDESTGRPSVTGEAPVSDSNGILEKYSELYSMNEDLIGWITIEGTAVDYPVMQTIFDEEYYLHRGFDKEESREGLPFLDCRCSVSAPSTNLIIYGHNMKNGDMFADLLKYENYSFYDSHRYIRFDTIHEEGIYEIIAVFRTRVAYQGEDAFRFYNFIEADSTSDFEEYLSNISDLCLYDTDATAIASDYLLTLSTCEYSVDDGRFVVVARKIAASDGD